MKIVVIGAYGYTARIICARLNERGWQFSISGRDEEKLKTVADQYEHCNRIITGDLSFQEFSSKLLNDFDVFINTAGPFTEESAPFLKLLANCSDKTYLDITGELGFVVNSRKIYHELAIENGNLIVHGCAFESLISALMYADLAASNRFQKVSAFYHFENTRSSPGTRMTMKLNKFRDQLRYQNGQWSVSNTTEIVKPQLDSDLVAIPYPLPEVAFFSWMDAVQSAGSYMMMSKAEAMFVGQSKAKGTAEEALAKLKRRKPTGPSAEERSQQRFSLFLKAESADETVLKCIEGKDMYLLTARAIEVILAKIIAGARLKGVVNPAEFFLDEEAEVLAELGVTYSTINQKSES